MKNVINRTLFTIFGFVKKHKRLSIVIGIVLLAGLLFLRSKQTPEPTYQTAKVTRETIVSTVSTSGSLLQGNSVNVVTQSSGTVKAVYVKNGDKVVAGQKLAEINLDVSGLTRQASAWSSYLSAKNNLEKAKINLWTLQAAEFAANQTFMNDAVERDLSVDDPVYIQENAKWLAAEAEYKNQANVITQSESSLNNAWLSYQQVSNIVYAPTNGTIDGLVLVTGMPIGNSTANSTNLSAQQVAVITVSGNPIASVTLSEIDVTKVKVGNKVTLALDAFSDKTFTGKLATINTAGTVSSGVTSYPAVITFDAEIPGALPNMTVTANIITDIKSDVLVVPSQAIQTSNGISTVRTMVNGKIVPVEVTTGTVSDSMTEISSGLEEGQTIVTNTVSTTTTSNSTSVFGGSMRIGAMGGQAPGGR